MGGRVEWVHLCHGKNIKVRGQLLGVSSLFSHMGPKDQSWVLVLVASTLLDKMACHL